MGSRLQRVLDVLGWQGGTIHQVQDELTRMGFKGWEGLELAPSTFEDLLQKLERKLKE